MFIMLEHIHIWYNDSYRLFCNYSKVLLYVSQSFKNSLTLEQISKAQSENSQGGEN